MTFRLLSASRDHRFEPGTFDVRGWRVRTSEEDPVGAVHDMVLDETGAPRYLDVRLAGGDCVLVPIGEARVRADADEVTIGRFSARDLARLPRFGDDASLLSAAFEAEVCAAFAPPGDAEALGARAPHLQSMNAQQRAFDVAAGDADPRGWTVTLGDGTHVGVVRDLLFDAELLKVRHLVVELSEGETTRSVLIPSVYAQLNADAANVCVDVIERQDLDRLPTYRGAPLAQAAEDVTIEVFTGGATQGDTYRHPRYNPDHFFGPRRKLAGIRH